MNNTDPMYVSQRVAELEKEVGELRRRVTAYRETQNELVSSLYLQSAPRAKSSKGETMEQLESRAVNQAVLLLEYTDKNKSLQVYNSEILGREMASTAENDRLMRVLKTIHAQTGGVCPNNP